MNISKIFSSKERVKILKFILFKENEFGVNEIAKELKISKGLVSKYFAFLVKEKILKRKNGKFVVRNNSYVKSLRILFNLQKINPNIFKKYKFIKAAGIYGSCVKGENTENSDVDLWIKVKEMNEREIVKLSSELRKKVENIKILILNDKKINDLKRKDPLFYYSLYFGSIVIYGEESEL